MPAGGAGHPGWQHLHEGACLLCLPGPLGVLWHCAGKHSLWLPLREGAVQHGHQSLFLGAGA